MRAFTAVLKNDLWRSMEHKSRFFLFTFLTAGAIIAAIFMNTGANMAGNIAVVSKNDLDFSSTHYLNSTQLETAPPMSDLVMGKYDAIVIFDESGGHTIQTIRNDEFKQTIDAIISDPSGYHSEIIDTRGIGTNIIGFMTMFILMQGNSIMFLFAEDKEKKQIRRIAASPVSFTGYLCGHSFFVFAFLLAPSMIMLSLVKIMLNIDIGFGLLDYLFLVSLICALATAFSLFLNALVKTSDSASMIGSASIVLTSILAGSFYPFEKGNKILETAVRILPQKAYITLSDLMENGKNISAWFPYGLYVIILIVLFFSIAVIKTRKNYVKS